MLGSTQLLSAIRFTVRARVLASQALKNGSELIYDELVMTIIKTLFASRAVALSGNSSYYDKPNAGSLA